MVARMTTIPNPDELLSAVAVATRAPSVHNTQPWLFRLIDGGVELYADRRRQLAVSDAAGTAMRVSCGAAIFNLRLAIAQLGLAPEVRLLPDPSTPDLLARVTAGRPRPPTPDETSLHAAIPRRHSNRQPFLNTAVPLEVRFDLLAAAQAEGCWLDLVLGPVALDMVAELVRSADRVLLMDEAYRAELAAWTRLNDDSPDGVPRRAGGPAPEPHDLLVQRDFGAPPRSSGRDFETDPLVGVLGSEAGTARDDLAAGQALQHVLLAATRAGLVTSLLSQPIEVAQAREQLRVGLRRHGQPQMLLRFGYGVPGSPTTRRPVSEVLLSDAGTEPVAPGRRLG
jgi:nitroreductase